MRDDFETRSVAEFRAEDDGAFISGHAANFGSLDSKGSVFARTAFKKTIRERGDKVKVFFNHDYSRLIGKTTELRNDSQGLKFRAAIVEGTDDGRNVMALVRAGVLDGMSFGFRSVQERPGTREDNIQGLPSGARPEEVRVITEANLLEISPTPRPSNENPKITDFRSDGAEDVIAEILESIRNADLTPEDLERITEEVRSLADTTDQSQPPSTEDEVRRHNEDIDILFVELELG